MYLAYQSINASASLFFYLEEWLEEAEIHQFILSLEIFAIVPFNHRIFKFTDTICVAVDFQNAILDGALLPIERIC